MAKKRKAKKSRRKDVGPRMEVGRQSYWNRGRVSFVSCGAGGCNVVICPHDHIGDEAAIACANKLARQLAMAGVRYLKENPE